MDTKFGFTTSLWETSQEEMRQVLASCAKRQDIISYSELVAHVHTVTLFLYKLGGF